MKGHICFVILFSLLVTCGYSQKHAASRSRMFELSIRDTLRQAKVYAPTTELESGQPLVFVFHGRRGTISRVEQQMPVHKLWSEAVVVYPQGLEVASGAGGSGEGWLLPTEKDCGRDVEFFDKMLETIEREYRIDKNRIYIVGHSNGGSFTFGLWATRGETFAAIAPVHSFGARLSKKLIDARPVKPLFFTAATDDDIVQYSRVSNIIFSTIELNRCKGKELRLTDELTLHPSLDENDVMTYVHTGGHRFPTDVLPHIIYFFRTHRKR